jgi:hypothetical protein
LRRSAQLGKSEDAEEKTGERNRRAQEISSNQIIYSFENEDTALSLNWI